MSKKLAVWNGLGGVGKTTLAVNLGCQLAKSATVCVVDTDVQAAATRWISAGKLPVAGEFLTLIDKIDSTSWRETLGDLVDDELSIDFDSWTQRLSAMSVDIVVIDLPSQPDAAALAAFMAADVIIVPFDASVHGQHYAKVATSAALKFIRGVLARRADTPARIVLVPSRADRRLAEQRAVAATFDEMGELVGPSIGLSSAFDSSAQARSWVGAFAPRSVAYKQIVALAELVRHCLPTFV